MDPRAAVARLEQLRATTDAYTKALLELREKVVLRLGYSYEHQWWFVWGILGYGQMKPPLDRDVCQDPRGTRERELFPPYFFGKKQTWE